MSYKFQCNVSKIGELQEIIQEYKKFINSGIINEYKMTDEELSKKGCAYADSILSDLDLKNKYIVIKYILDKGNNEADKILVNIDLETRKKILSYIYWKYRRINSKIKVDLADIKDKFGIKRNESIDKYIIPLKLDVECVICGSKAKLTRYRYDFFSNIRFKCTNCKHEEFEDNNSYRYSGYYSYNRYMMMVGFMKCNCKRCMENKGNVHLIFKNNIRAILDKLKNEIIKMYERALNSRYGELNDLSYEEMKMDYKINASMLSRDVRKILSYKPDNEKELMNIIEKNLDKDKDYWITRDYIINSLASSKVIYKTSRKDVINQLSNGMNEIINEILGIPLNDDKFLNTAIEWIENSTSEEFWSLLTESEKTIECRKIERLINTMRRLLKDIIAFDGVLSIDSNEDLMQPDIQLNPHYFYEIDDSYLENDRNEKFLKNVFKSDSEKNLCVVLANKYKNLILIPNLKIYKFLNIEKMKEVIIIFFGKESFEYLKTCEFDFVLFDIDGLVVKVIELQNGDQRNEIECIEKNKLKRKLFNLLEIAYEEMF